MARNRFKHLLACACGAAILTVAVPPAATGAWGDVAFKCDGEFMQGHSQAVPLSSPWTWDLHRVCTPRTSYRRANDGAWRNWGYGPVGGYAYAAAGVAPIAGAAHQGFNDYDKWLGVTS